MSKHFLLILIWLGFLSSCSNQHVDYIQSFYYNEKFRYLVNKKEYEKAQSAELMAKENLQNHYELDSNLAVAFNLLTKNDEAEKSFDEALKNIEKQFPTDSPDKMLALFTVHFNRGVFYGSQSKIDPALAEYQKALDLVPNSIETKTNIELLIQKQKEDQKKEGQGKGDKDPKDKPQDNSGDSKDENKDGDKDKDQEKQKQDRKQNGKYQPKPFQGDQLSEGDVKKILGELSQQDKKIRSQFDKKEKTESPFEGKNEKDW